jgi:hypothetical protein
MSRVLLVGVIFFVLAPAAAGKGFEYRVCGVSGCERLSKRTSLPGLFGVRDLAPPAAPAPFYELRGADRQGREVGRWAYVPSAHAVWRRFSTSGFATASVGTWTRLTRDEETQWREAVRKLSPFAAPTVRRATVAGKPVSDPASYLALYEARAQVTVFSGDPLEIVLESGRPSPWTGPEAAFAFYPRESVVTTAGRILVLPVAVAERVQRRLALG